MAIKKYLIPYLAEAYPWTQECPRAIRDGAVAEACQSIKAAISKYTRTNEFGRSKHITANGITVNRDINGARGIFLRTLVDSPILIEGAR
ncbi:hypothetical protein CKO09_06305 [Chromatium weissei]|nr:hypothetical protein [Chromatium weissei]